MEMSVRIGETWRKEMRGEGDLTGEEMGKGERGGGRRAGSAGGHAQRSFKGNQIRF